jgi:hypothetical protein
MLFPSGYALAKNARYSGSGRSAPLGNVSLIFCDYDHLAKRNPGLCPSCRRHQPQKVK